MICRISSARKKSFFRAILDTKFNIIFGLTCLLLKEKKYVTKNKTEMKDLQTELKVQNLRANAFFCFV